MTTVELPDDAALLRKIVRILGQANEWEAQASVLGAMLRLNPKDWRAWLSRYDALVSARDLSAAGDCLDDALAQALLDARDTVVFRRALQRDGRNDVIVKMQELLLARNPGDWRAALQYAVALEDTGHRELACKVVADQVSTLSVPASRRALLEQLVQRERDDLLAAALDSFAVVDRKGLMAYLTSAPGMAQERLLAKAREIRVPGWDPLQLVLAQIAAMENRGEWEAADRAYSAIEGSLVREPPPGEPTPTPSTLMFRNRPLLECLVSAATMFIERNGTVSIHVGACSTGEEVYSLALVLADAGLIDRCTLSASDVDPLLVQRARSGVIEGALAASTPSGLLDSCHRRPDGHLGMPGWVLQRIAFSVVDLAQPAAGEQFDILVANNVLVHFPAEDANRMLGAMVTRVQPAGLLCIGGIRHDTLKTTIDACGLFPVTTLADAVFNGWRLQRRAWYMNPRPYWALPPARLSADEPWRHTTLLARSAETGRKLDHRLAAIGAGSSIQGRDS